MHRYPLCGWGTVYRRDEVNEEREELLRPAIKAEFGGHPPAIVEQWLSEEGLEL